MAKVCVIGGGAAGMAAAIFAAERGFPVHLFEQNEKLGKKLFITGKGRCNFTNACEKDELFGHVVTNPRFLYSAFNNFNSQDAIRFFEQLGVRTKVERGNRAFPASDHSSDIIRAMEKRLQSLDVKVHLKSRVQKVLTEPLSPSEADKKQTRQVTGILLENGAVIDCDAVILATGGLSYPSTGATGDGLRIASSLGHTVQKTRPALVPMETGEDYIPKLQGLSLRNVTLTIPYGKKKKFQEFGEMLFTHFGISGPLALSASSYIGRALEDGPLPAFIDLKPALTDEQLDARLLREFERARNKELKNAVASLFPAKLRPVMIEVCGIPADKPVNEITREERAHFRQLVKAFPFTITGLRGYNEAIITQGGIHVKEINPSTMESRLVQGFYVIGEVLDVDAVTGGFNLQIAWATADTCAAALH
ncbi:MAG: NAD(P)/FAD-dependent oxidoreductase [Eubacterium sp.]|nr:NAD(P)/FAD-dependent oxidoreductase [Eubacterium sp.]